ncbi:hypothetical protein OSB04_019271 [Centaurea solstitialis]|uniref:Integrase catalytic domain-containing protein n=1 Tax=Centaurea solstitialis TaxID=347529 RepID=A0AA38T9J0_9ASTR|nr:hypothetical protein OSB04_019271 [Centaurea solstitialis]
MINKCQLQELVSSQCTIDTVNLTRYRVGTDGCHKTFFDQKGISQNFSSVRTPHQNGVAERRNRP